MEVLSVSTTYGLAPLSPLSSSKEGDDTLLDPESKHFTLHISATTYLLPVEITASASAAAILVMQIEFFRLFLDEAMWALSMVGRNLISNVVQCQGIPLYF